jgi:hypothetical protein
MSQRTKQTQPNPKRKKPNSASHRAIEPPSQQRLTRNPMQPGKGSGLPDRPGRRPMMWMEALLCTLSGVLCPADMYNSSCKKPRQSSQSTLANAHPRWPWAIAKPRCRAWAWHLDLKLTGNLNRKQLNLSRQDAHPALCTSCPFVTTSGVQCVSTERLASCRVTRALG